MSRPAQIVLLALLTPVLSYSQAAQPPTAVAGGLQAQEASFQYVRSISGSKGTPDGNKFVMEDPRTIFYIPADRQVIVYMEWDGPIGKHHIEGFWKNPDGKVSVISDFDYEAKEKRFAAFWTLAISETAAVGTWTLEAHVDGQVAGTHSFQILSGTMPAGTISARRPLRSAEMYDHALKSAVIIEKLDAQGARSATASGFLMAPGWIVTAFEAIDGASKVRITLPDGRKTETAQVTAWDRWKNWAILKVDIGGLPFLRAAPDNSWSVGDQLNVLLPSAGGANVSVTAAINGKSDSPKAGARLNLASGTPTGGIGSAALNDFGEVVGIIVSNSLPGMSPLQMAGKGVQAPVEINVAMLAVPISVLPSSADETHATNFDQLVANGQFIPPIIPNKELAYGELAHSLAKQGNSAYPKDIASSFSRKDPLAIAFVDWDGQSKRKGLLTMRIYDIDNHQLNKDSTDKPLKLSLSPGNHSASSWEFNVTPLAPATYRLEVWLDDMPVWRTFFTVTE